MNEPNIDGLAKLREPFPKNQIGKLPKGGVTLDFVGHAHLTARLLDVDPLWDWEPMALDDDGLPRFDEDGCLWIRLTVCGKTRIGVGDAGGRRGGNAKKEAIGDALRNAAMRFGAALELWAKTDLDSDEPPRTKTPADRAREKLLAWIRAEKLDTREIAQRFKDEYGTHIADAEADPINAFIKVIAEERAKAKAEAKDAG